LDGIFSTLNGGSFFCVIDLTDPLRVNDESQKLLMINTVRTRDCINFRALCTESAVLRRFFNSLWRPCYKVSYLDDILIQGSDYADCFPNVQKVLTRSNNLTVRIQPSKCKWFQTEVKYLGHTISKNDRSQSPSLTQALVDAPVPSNVKELRSFLGLLNFFCFLFAVSKHPPETSQ